MAKRPLHFIWLADCSGSMSIDGKIQSLNQAIREALPHMVSVAGENPNAEVLVRAIKFSSGAEWHFAQPTPVESFQWADLQADGVTDLGKALSMVAQVLSMPPMESRALPPVLVLVSDGMPTDDFNSGLNQLMALPWGKKAVRISIAIGRDAELDPLQKFIGHSELKPLQANNPDQLVRFIKWASTAVLQAASAPPSRAAGSGAASQNVPVPPPPVPSDDDDAAVMVRMSRSTEHCRWCR